MMGNEAAQQLGVGANVVMSPRQIARRLAAGTPIMTTLSGARAAALGIAALPRRGYEVRTVQEYH
jgi:hypothetical protein